MAVRAVRATPAVRAEEFTLAHWPEMVLFVLAMGVGIASVKAPILGLAFGALIVAIGVAALDNITFERGLTMLLVGGAMAMGYGWANLGIPGPIPIPLTEILLFPLVGIAVLNPRTRIDKKTLIPLALFGLLVAVRLLFDYPVWHIYAVRDTTEAVEASILLVGYRAVVRDGIEFWIKNMRYLAAIVLAWGTVYPMFPSLTTATGPTVGLQRPTSLLDPTGVKFSVIAAALYFVVFSRGWIRQLAVLGLVTGLLGVYQARTLFILLPVSILVLGWATHRLGKSFAFLMAALLLGIGVIMWAQTRGVVGGNHQQTSLSYTTAELGTLAGKQGPHSATIAARSGFLREDLRFVFKSPFTAIVGVGLGPDLTFGQYVGNQGQLVRNPHNDYLEQLTRLGILGFSLWMAVLFRLIVPIAKAARRGQGSAERFCAWILASCVVYLGVAGAQPLLSFPYGAIPLFFLLGMGAAAAKQVKAKAQVSLTYANPRMEWEPRLPTVEPAPERSLTA
jgi:hypothetical protein